MRTIRYSVFLCFALLFSSCGVDKDKKDIMDVAQRFINAYASFSYAEMKTLATIESATVIDGQEQVQQRLPEAAKLVAKDAASHDEVLEESIVISGDKATGFIKQKGGNIPVVFKKVEKKWLVDLSTPDETEIKD